MAHRDNQRHCIGCYYYHSLDGSGHGTKACHYLLDTGNTRGCSPENCVRKISEGGIEMQKLTETDKRNIVAARQAGTKVTELAKQYDVDKSSIYNVLKAWEKSSESTFSEAAADNDIDAEEIACEFHGTPPVSVDCDTDIEAFNKAWEDYRKETEKEPASAATDTSSNAENIDTVSTDIVPENPGNVKPPEANPVEIDMSDTYEGGNVYRDMPIPPKEHTFSTAAVDAVYDCICRKQEEIAELDENMTMLYAEIDRLNEQVNALNDMQMYAEAELGRLWEDYENMSGGVSSAG